MKSDYLMYALLAQYVLLGATSAWERSMGATLYWTGAAVIISGAFLMRKGF